MGFVSIVLSFFHSFFLSFFHVFLSLSACDFHWTFERELKVAEMSCFLNDAVVIGRGCGGCIYLAELLSSMN